MKAAAIWAMMLMTVLFQDAVAWGQLRVRSGAVRSGAEHQRTLERRVFQLTNEARRRQHLSPLELDGSLTSQARARGVELAREHRINQGDGGREAGIKQYDQEEPARIRLAGRPGENIHMGYKDDYADVETAARLIVNGFMGSLPQRGNILNPAYTRMGVGVALQGKESYVIQEFGQKEK